MKSENFTKHQNQLIKEFVDMTEGSKKQAQVYLARSKWNIQAAVNAFFDDGAVPEREEVKSNSHLDKLFEQLSVPSQKNKKIRYIDEERFAKFNDDYMGIGEEDVVLGHILLNIMEVETSGYIEKHHFLKLFAYLHIEHANQLREQVPQLQKDLHHNKQLYKSMWSKLYGFYLIGRKEQSLDFDIAAQLWAFYLPPIMALHKPFLEYLQQLQKRPHKVHRDLWNMMFEFATTVKDVSQVQESDGWPVFIDDFVEYVREKNAK